MLSVRLHPETERRLAELAKRAGRTKAGYAREIIETNIEDLDDYTPHQRRMIDARLVESEEDVRKKRTFGPFKTADEMIASMKDQLKKRAALKTSKRSR